eukprot:Em0003g939a
MTFDDSEVLRETSAARNDTFDDSEVLCERSIEVSIATMRKSDRSKVDEVYVCGFVPSYLLPNKCPVSLDPFLEPLVTEVLDLFINGIEVDYAVRWQGFPLEKHLSGVCFYYGQEIIQHSLKYLDMDLISKQVIEERLEAVPWTSELRNGRIPKNITKRLGFWKAEEFQKFCYSASEYILGGILPDHEYHVWVLIVRITEMVYNVGRSGWTKDDIDLLRNLITKHNILTEEVEGITSCVITLHSLIHMPEEKERFSSPDNYWCYSFERAVKGYVLRSSNNRNLELTFALAECRREFLKFKSGGSVLQTPIQMSCESDSQLHAKSFSQAEYVAQQFPEAPEVLVGGQHYVLLSAWEREVYSHAADSSGDPMYHSYSDNPYVEPTSTVKSVDRIQKTCQVYFYERDTANISERKYKRSASTVSSDSGLVMTDNVLEVTPVLMQSPMSSRENIEVPGDDAACSSSNAIEDVLDPVASMVSEGSTVEKAPSEVGRNEPVSVEVSTVTSATAVSEAVSTQAVAAKFGLHFDSRTGVLDPVALVGCRVSVSEKHDIIKLGPCQPSKHVLNHSQKSMQRHCSEQVFVHSDGVRRQWISYSVSKGALYCLPCLLFSDATLRGEHWRANQGNAFTTNGFCNWKKQYSAVLQHESSCAHRNAIVSQALFLQDDTVQQAFARADSVENARKRAIVAKNRTVLERIVKVLMLLGRQGLPIRGHREMMTDSMTNTGNFLETIKLLSTYDPPLQEHLEKIIERHQSASEGSSEQKGRGSVLTFMSYKSQNKLISIINEHITCTIVKAIHNCRAWSLMADTTPDISHHEQVSICVRIVHLNGHVSEHLLACQRAPGTTAEDLYGVIMSVLKLRDVSFDKLIAQAYDGASNMSGCYNGLQSLIQTRINPNILYVHCYAHCLNLVISDAAATSVDVVTLFGNLETLYVLFTRSQKVHGLFEEVQRSQGCAIRSLKRLNTVRWSAREMCLSTFLERYECILLTLNQIQTEVSFDLKHRSEAAGLLSSIQTREFLATAFLFQEIFAKTGPLSRYLQSVNMDYAKALAMIDSVIASLERMRSAPQDIIDIMERSVQDSSSIQWKTTRVSRRMCRNTEDGEVLETSEESWQRKTFFVALDTIIASMRRRFDKNRSH